MTHRLRTPLVLTLAVLAGLSASDCKGGGGGLRPIAVLQANITEGAVWQLNRAIEITFDAPVDLTSVNFQSVQFTNHTTGQPVVGTFSLTSDDAGAAGTVLVFQPRCPVLEDLSDGGFQAGAVHYTMSLVQGANSVKAGGGGSLTQGFTVNFRTPIAPEPIFLDTVAGPPAVAPGQTILPELPLNLGLNLLSDPLGQILVALDQPLTPGSSNIKPDSLRLEYFDGAGTWRTIPSVVTMVANCFSTGAVLSVQPIGVLPAGATVRLVKDAGLKDLVGDSGLLDTVVQGGTGEVQVAMPSGDEVHDAIMESFQSTESFDADLVSLEPTAVWGSGTLTAAMSFTGTETDVSYSSSGFQGTKTVSSDLTQLSGTKENGATGQLTISNGVLEVKDFVLEAGKTWFVQGDSPLTILASGDVTIDGFLLVEGIKGGDVNTINNAPIPQEGSAGHCGGGNGGTGSSDTTQSTGEGDQGEGPFHLANGGGLGGETGRNPNSSSTQRGGAGGGGGSFAEAGTQGDDGDNVASGALSGSPPPIGGMPGPVSFTDGDADNDFFGNMALYAGTLATGAVLQGELPVPTAGQGGGAGGDSIRGNSFPDESGWKQNEQGAGAASGGGLLTIRALGEITIGGAGVISVNGGRGGFGGRPQGGGFTMIGGSSGGGSGGMIILESATSITNSGAVMALGGPGGGLKAPYAEGFTTSAVTAGSRTMIDTTVIPKFKTGVAMAGDQVWLMGQRRTIVSSTTTSLTVDIAWDAGKAIQQGTYYRVHRYTQHSKDEGQAGGRGGHGGNGVIQVHVPDPYGGGIPGSSWLDTDATTGVLTYRSTSPPAAVLLPTISSRSVAQSEWIATGFTSQGPMMGLGAPEYDLPGVRLGMLVDDGELLIDATGQVVDQDLKYDSGAGLTSDVLVSSLFLPAGLEAVADDAVLTNPMVVVGDVLHLQVSVTDPSVPVGGWSNAFEIIDVEPDGLGGLRIHTDPEDGSLVAYVSDLQEIAVGVEPRAVQAGSDQSILKGFLPTGAKIIVQIQGAPETSLGSGVPDAGSASAWVPDDSDLDLDGNPDFPDLSSITTLPFIRFRVTFDVGKVSQPGAVWVPGQDLPQVRSLKIPYRF